jgi:methyl-accepting chemotaxis protein
MGLTESLGLEGELRSAVRNLENLTNKIDRLDLANKVLMMRRHEKDYMLRRDDRFADELSKRVAEFRSLLEVGAMDSSTRDQAQKLVAAYEATFKSWVEASKAVTGQLQVASKEYAAIEPTIIAMIGALRAELARVEETTRATDALAGTVITAVIVLSSLIAFVVAFLVGRSLTSSIKAAIQSMVALANGDHHRMIGNTERTDEIGEIARALAVFQSNAKERRRLEDEAEAKRQTELLRQTNIEKLIAEFRATVDRVTKSLGTHTRGLHSTAEALGSAATETSSNARTAGEAASSAAGSASTVAAAAEQLSASITEISNQAQRASVVVAETASAAAKTNDDIVQLDAMSERVGNIVNLITQIASQTNLLALNATIEAARAGESGRGFAVVASEVKNLATKTAEATQEIADLVTGVRASTATAVDSLRLITGRIDEVNHLATAIAAAVEEQNAATMEIARSVTSAAENTHKAMHGSDQVKQAAEVTTSQAAQVLDVAKSVHGAAEEITASVVSFLDAVNADVEERRKTLRHSMRRAAKLHAGSNHHGVTVLNVSLKGLRVSSAPSGLTRGQKVGLDLGNGKIPARVIWSNGSDAGLEFEVPISETHMDEIRALSGQFTDAA